MPGSIRCPQCGHVLFAIELPVASSVQAGNVGPPEAPLLLRVAEAARLLRVSRAATYQSGGDASGIPGFLRVELRCFPMPERPP